MLFFPFSPLLFLFGRVLIDCFSCSTLLVSCFLQWSFAIFFSHFMDFKGMSWDPPVTNRYRHKSISLGCRTTVVVAKRYW
ncbi:hypothetical protein QBC32DRAFT_61870 [Pseudoneurospora amorphoporcata]|uniref:Uncharacterized protein n=1 Tax=Pseudoneurospora amorphoporcata TaxID=241081 RepID=A0AAN6SBP1_9PEZI|nr:hypothetical protein QBC32DRAFT_61870 [Pseudoneurospora amorphoporcata]